MTKHLIIPDAHNEVGVNNKRFTALGKVIVETRPDVVVCLGDFSSFDSLSSYDKGKKSHEGRRYKRDVDHANDALDRVEHELKKIKSRYAPRKVITWGNHEDRVDRAVNSNAELEGTMSKDDVLFKDNGWETYPFLQMVNIDDIHYAHYFVSGVMSRAIGGESPALAILKKHYVSAVAGHLHLFDYAERTRGDGCKINGLVAGCYCDHVPSYAVASAHMWWAGLVLLDNVYKGDYDFGRISLKTIMKEFGDKA